MNIRKMVNTLTKYIDVDYVL